MGGKGELPMIISLVTRPSLLRVLSVCAVLAISQSVSQQPMAAAPSQSAPLNGLDNLTAPIALYPDALAAQILVASTKLEELRKFAGWMAANSGVKGSELQAYADREGFDACFLALAAFPQVVQMMVEKLDWTTQLGQAFTSDKKAVFDSIQRLRAQAQAAGNLKTTQQQEVQTQTTSGGDQVIVIQPANPQVVYVPQYNPVTVYAPAPAPSAGSTAAAAAIGFTAGIIIGASANNYYYGPYGWHGAAMYEEMWEDRYDYLEDRQENRLEYMEDRQERVQENAGQRQANQDQRQSSRQTNQDQRQSSRQTNQDQREAGRQTSQDQRQSGRDTTQAQRQSTVQDRQVQGARSERQPSATAAQRDTQWDRPQRASAATSSGYGGHTASQRSGSSGGFSGYGSGSATRSERSRGTSSLSASRGGGGRSGGGRGGRRR
jgi:hypothetical protein